ncbi:YdeI/OmpD-associated family protein [Aequorivita xiaoshiensis]|nr:YdeI/OmpD-associated family protein [Aequorivita xiaoshiensis]
MKPVKKKDVSIPLLLKSALATDKILEKSFYKLTPGRQREYAEYISEAKREATQQKRLDKSSELIKKGVGLHDKYKNC